MEDKLIGFILQYLGVPNVGDTPQNTGQCVGLIEKWTDFLGLPHTWGNAIDLLADADPDAYDLIYNTSTNFPACGDIVVFGSNWGNGDGHAGINLVADINSIILFQQNNPKGVAPLIARQSYGTANDVLGWLHPILPANVVVPSTPAPVVPPAQVNPPVQPAHQATAQNSTPQPTVPQTEPTTIPLTNQAIQEPETTSVKTMGFWQKILNLFKKKK